MTDDRAVTAPVAFVMSAHGSGENVWIQAECVDADAVAEMNPPKSWNVKVGPGGDFFIRNLNPGCPVVWTGPDGRPIGAGVVEWVE